MRIALVFFGTSSREKMLAFSKALAKGIEMNGHQVDIVDGTRDVNSKLTIYEYIVIGAEPVSLLGNKIPARVAEYLSSSGMISGKRSFAFVIKKGFSPASALSKLMKTMEHEGMYLKFSEVFSNPNEAEAIGKRLRVS